MEHSLKRKIRYFLSSHHRGRSEIHDALAELRKFGSIIVIGGILRDLVLSNNLEFRSDLDLVIEPDNPDMLRRYLLAREAESNRFGGYSVRGRKWTIDIWFLKDTWANRNGLVRVKEFTDLLETTFFNCDAIIYDPSRGTISTRSGYFEDMAQRRLELNLEPNPNPIGNTVRAFRYSAQKGFSWGPRLSLYVSELLDRVRWQEITEYEFGSYQSRVIARLKEERFKEALREHIRSRSLDCFVPVEQMRWKQLSLALEEEKGGGG